MPRWTKEEYELYQATRSAATLRRNAVVEPAASAGDSGLRAHNEKPVEGRPLGSAAPRKEACGKGAVLGTARRHILFRIFSTRPADYDGYDIKELQDCLRHAGLLDDDSWNLLYGTVISEKAYSKEEERTEIELI